MIKTIRQELTETAQGYDYRHEVYGLLQFLPRTAASAFAIFGMFERKDGYTLYTMDSAGMSLSECHSHYLDDLAALRRGQIQIVDRLTT